jgi:hypothetical protein
MKKIIVLVALSLIGCSQDPSIETPTPLQIDNSLVVKESQGLKLESYIVNKQVKINSKLETAGNYKIKIYNFDGKLVSQEKVVGEKGDNILSIYVSALPVSSYTVELQTEDDKLIGRESFSMSDTPLKQ